MQHTTLLPTLHTHADAADAARRCEVAAWRRGNRRETTREGGCRDRARSPRSWPGQRERTGIRHDVEVHGGAVAGQAQGTDDERCFSFIPPVINSWPGVGGAGHLLYSVGLSLPLPPRLLRTLLLLVFCILYSCPPSCLCPSLVPLCRLWTRRGSAGSADRPRRRAAPLPQLTL